MTEKFVSPGKPSVVAFTRMTFSAPSALPRYDMVASQIHIAHGGGENDMHRLGKGHFHAVGRYHLSVRQLSGDTPVQVVACRILHRVGFLCVCRTHAQQEGRTLQNTSSFDWKFLVVCCWITVVWRKASPCTRLSASLSRCGTSWRGSPMRPASAPL